MYFKKCDIWYNKQKINVVQNRVDYQMKQYLQQLLTHCVDNLKNAGLIESDFEPKIIVDNTKDRNHGDFATNLAMLLAKPMKKNPREVANLIIEQIPRIKNKLAILLPTIFPILKSECPSTAAVELTISSGIDVPIATIVSPIIIVGI